MSDFSSLSLPVEVYPGFMLFLSDMREQSLHAKKKKNGKWDGLEYFPLVIHFHSFCFVPDRRRIQSFIVLGRGIQSFIVLGRVDTELSPW